MTRYRWIAAATLLAGCLPGDNRPPPGSILFTAEPSAEVLDGVSTSDGWQISFERLLAGLGDVSLENDSCNSYADAGYERLFDFVAATRGPQKLGQVFGLGACSLRLRLRTPGADAPLGTGVTAADLAFMRTPGTDVWTSSTDPSIDAGANLRGVSVFVRGKASKGAVTKRFAWTFRQRYSVHDCPAPGAGGGDAGLLSDIALRGGDAREIRVVIHGEELFRESLKDGAALRFQALADADADGDQTITLDELAKILGPPPDMDAGLPSGTDGGEIPLADFIYELLVPRMVHLGDGGPCQVEIRRFGR